MGINSIPVEILGDIFLDCVHNAHHTECIRAPIRLSSVCRRWRDVSLSLRNLWTYLYYHVGVPQECLIDVFNTWLHRSNGAPLEFWFMCCLTSKQPQEYHRIAERIVSMLFAHQWHWEEVHLILKFRTSPSFPSIRLTNMPMLTTLSLSLALDNGADGGIVSLAQSPKIEHLSLGGIRLLRFKKEPALLSARSALFDITSIRTVQQCREFLEATPNLKSLQHNEIRGPTHDEDSPVISHNLNRLSLSGPAPHLLIDKLALPALTELDYRDLETWNGGEILSTFIQRSLPPLTSLVIGGNCADEDTIISILPLLPLLQMLNLFACTISAQLFDILSIPGDPNAVLLAQDTSDRITCPDMRHFSLYNYIVVGEARECADALCTMLESRWNVLRLWDDLVDIQGTRYPFFASDRRRLRRHIREGRLFRARCSSYSIPD